MNYDYFCVYALIQANTHLPKHTQTRALANAVDSRAEHIYFACILLYLRISLPVNSSCSVYVAFFYPFYSKSESSLSWIYNITPWHGWYAIEWVKQWDGALLYGWKYLIQRYFTSSRIVRIVVVLDSFFLFAFFFTPSAHSAACASCSFFSLRSYAFCMDHFTVHTEFLLVCVSEYYFHLLFYLFICRYALFFRSHSLSLSVRRRRGCYVDVISAAAAAVAALSSLMARPICSAADAADAAVAYVCFSESML